MSESGKNDQSVPGGRGGGRLAGVTHLGRYEILRELGRGAMGVVYEAVDPKIGRKVALKLLHEVDGVSEQDLEEFKQRFFREARTAGMLAHPNIVVIYDVDSDEKNVVTYMAMELLKGQPLNDLLKSGVRFTREQVLDICIQVAEGLDHAHRQGIVHRDVKPANLMLLEDGTVKITDFGIAKIQTSNLTKTGQFLGTPNYMSPEQVIGHVVDGRSDLFSLGIILYELLTGEKPFMGSSLTTITYQIVNVDPIEPSKIQPGIPKVFDQIVGKLLKKAPDERYQTGKDVAEALRIARDPNYLAGGSSSSATKVGTASQSLQSTRIAAGDTTAGGKLNVAGQATATGSTPAFGATMTTNQSSAPGVEAVQAAPPSRKGLYALVGAVAAVALLVIANMTLRGGGESPASASGPGGASSTATQPAGGTAAAALTPSGATQGVLPAATGPQAVPGSGTAPAKPVVATAVPPPSPPPQAGATAPAPTPRTKPRVETTTSTPLVPPAAFSLPEASKPAEAAPEPAAAVAMAKVRLVFEHQLKTGVITVLLGDKQIASYPFASDKKKGGTIQREFDVPDGTYTVRLCLESPDLSETPSCPQRRWTFVMNTTATIRAEHLKILAAPPKFFMNIE